MSVPDADSISWPPNDLNYRVSFRKLKKSDALFEMVSSARMKGQMSIPEIEEKRALELATAWTEVLIDIATKCKDSGEMDFVKVVTDAIWPALTTAKMNGIPMENIRATPFVDKRVRK